MTQATLMEQAARLESLLPRLARRLFTLEPDHPAAELPVAQLRVCSILQAGARTPSAIGEELGISVSAVTQLADRLERSGLVERVAALDDRRVRRLQLTPRGAEMMRSRRELRVCSAAEALEQLPADLRETVLLALETLLQATTAAAPEVARERILVDG